MSDRTERLIARTGLTTAAAVLAMAMLLLTRQAFTSHEAGVEIGKTAPDFTLPTTTGQTLCLSDFRGQSLVLFFGSDTCPLSQTYADKLLTLAQSCSPGVPVKFLAINSNPRHIPGTSPTLLDSSQIPTLLDPDARVFRAYGATVTPTFCVIGPNGTLRYAGSFDNGSANPLPKDQYLPRALDRTLNGIPCLISSTQAFGRSLNDSLIR